MSLKVWLCGSPEVFIVLLTVNSLAAATTKCCLTFSPALQRHTSFTVSFSPVCCCNGSPECLSALVLFCLSRSHAAHACVGEHLARAPTRLDFDGVESKVDRELLELL